MKHKLNQIILADCMDIMRDIPDKYFEIAIVDPPYGIGNFSPTGGSKGTACKGEKWNINWNDSIPEIKYFEEMYRISKNQIIWGANYYNSFPGMRGALIWHKGNINPVFSQCEIAGLSFQNRVDYYFQNWQGGGQWGKTKNIHPCQKPVALYRWLLQKYAKPGDKIIDTHSGSGSCAIACHYEKHDFLAIEKDKDYYDASVKRLEEVRAQGVLF